MRTLDTRPSFSMVIAPGPSDPRLPSFELGDGQFERTFSSRRGRRPGSRAARAVPAARAFRRGRGPSSLPTAALRKGPRGAPPALYPDYRPYRFLPLDRLHRFANPDLEAVASLIFRIFRKPPRIGGDVRAASPPAGRSVYPLRRGRRRGLPLTSFRARETGGGGCASSASANCPLPMRSTTATGATRRGGTLRLIQRMPMKSAATEGPRQGQHSAEEMVPRLHGQRIHPRSPNAPAVR